MVERENKSAAKKVLIIMLLVELFAVLAIFLLTVIFKDENSTPSIFGNSFYITDNEKMDVQTDSLVLAKNGRPDGSVVGGVILCENLAEGTGIYRVVGVESTNETFIYNVCLDSEPTNIIKVDAKNVVGECKYAYHTAGRVLIFMKSKTGVIICVLIPVIILAVIELVLGFIKEMKKRELEKKREKVRHEQERHYSTKRRRDRAFTFDDFKNEEQTLKSRYNKKNRDEISEIRKPVRRIKVSDEQTKIVNIDEESRARVRAKAMQIQAAVDSAEENDRAYEAASESSSRGSFDFTQDLSFNRYSDDDLPFDTSEVEETYEYAAAAPAETVEPEVYEAPVPEKTEVEPPKPKAPAMSLNEMMDLMAKSKAKLQKDIEKNK